MPADAKAGDASSSAQASPAAAAAAAAGGAAPPPPLLGLFKENLSITPTSSELRDFAPFLPGGRLLLHSDRSLYKALNQPALGLSSFFSWSLISKFRSDKSKFGGNMKGEGMVKGAIFVIGTREQGILASYLEELGTEIDFTKIEQAMQLIKSNKAADAPAAAAGEAASSAASKL